MSIQLWGAFLAGFGFGCAICSFINIGLFVCYRERPPAQEQKRWHSKLSHCPYNEKMDAALRAFCHTLANAHGGEVMTPDDKRRLAEIRDFVSPADTQTDRVFLLRLLDEATAELDAAMAALRMGTDALTEFNNAKS